MSPLISRFFLLLLLMAAGVAVGLPEPTTASIGIGIASGALAWMAWDGWCALRFINWLRQMQDDSSTSPQRFFGIYTEAMERIQRLLRQHARKTEESENRFRNLQAALQASPNGVIILDERGRIEWCNRTACQHFGLDPQHDLAQLVTHLLRAPALVKYLTERDFSEAITLESPLCTVTHPLRLAVQIFPYGQGQLFMLSRDITVLEQAEAMRRDFVANVSHEIRTPLTVLSGFIETLQTLPLSDAERASYLERMARQASRMNNLVGDLLTLSRLEGSSLPDAQEWVSIHTLFTRCEADARAFSAHMTGKDAPHDIVFDEEGTPFEIIGLADELQSAFFNLVNNAIRYTPPGGRIEVRWTRQGGSGRFSVRDSGPGIAPEHIPRLTERFYRVDSDRSRASGGTGLGLSIVKHVLQRHGATLNIESVPGQGACFTATFPESRIRASQVEPDIS